MNAQVALLQIHTVLDTTGYIDINFTIFVCADYTASTTCVVKHGPTRMMPLSYSSRPTFWGILVRQSQANIKYRPITRKEPANVPRSKPRSLR